MWSPASGEQAGKEQAPGGQGNGVSPRRLQLQVAPHPHPTVIKPLRQPRPSLISPFLSGLSSWGTLQNGFCSLIPASRSLDIETLSQICTSHK